MKRILETFHTSHRYDNYTYGHLWHLVETGNIEYVDVINHLHFLCNSIMRYSNIINNPMLHARVLLEALLIYNVEDAIEYVSIDPETIYEQIDIVYGYDSIALKEITAYVQSMEFMQLAGMVTTLVEEGWLFNSWLSSTSTIIVLTEVKFDEQYV